MKRLSDFYYSDERRVGDHCWLPRSFELVEQGCTMLTLFPSLRPPMNRLRTGLR